MTDHARIDPIFQFQRWFRQAARAGMLLPEAMAVATADTRARPSVRFMLLKEASDRGFVFYTNALSRKGRELRRNPAAALVFYWDRTRKQVRIEGPIEPVSEEESDAYWATRPRASRLAALAARQSAPIASRRELLDRVKRLRQKLAGREIPRPRQWKGFCVRPEAIEFWTQRPYRLHDRELFTRTRQGWKRQRLQP